MCEHSKSCYPLGKVCGTRQLLKMRMSLNRIYNTINLVQQRSLSKFPQQHGPVRTATCDGGAIRAKRDTIDRFCMP